MPPIITVEHLSKIYPLYVDKRDRLIEALDPFRRKRHTDFYALRDVSFTVEKGECVGIIGVNGSGKSTLLKVLTSVLHPTAGRMEVLGRVSALLELGAGFHPERTGRANVYFQGTLQGMEKEEIDAYLPSVIEFADIGDFIDQPVKLYSSGMFVRLAFAAAIQGGPDILIVDEALSVGDEKFVRKCFARLELIRDSGATILFVSHSGGTIIELCDRAILIDGGERLLTGTPKIVYGHYQRLLYAEAEKASALREQIRQLDREGTEQQPGVPQVAERDTIATSEITPHPKSPENQPGELKEFFDPNLKPTTTIAYESRGAIINGPEITTLNGRPVNHLIRGKWYRYSYRVEFSQDAHYVRFGMLIKTITGMELGGATSASTDRDGLPTIFTGSIYEVNFEFLCLLNTGVYFMNAGVSGEIDGESTYFYRLLDAVMFKVLPESRTTMTSIIDFQCKPGYKIVAS